MDDVVTQFAVQEKQIITEKVVASITGQELQTIINMVATRINKQEPSTETEFSTTTKPAIQNDFQDDELDELDYSDYSDYSEDYDIRSTGDYEEDVRTTG